MMPSSVRADILLATKEDLAEIGEFLVDLGGPLLEERFPGHTREQFYHWKYYENPVGSAVVAVARAGSKIVSLASAGPKRLQCAGETCLVYELGDFLTAPDHRKQGLFSRLIELLCEETARLGAAMVYVRPNDNSFPVLAKHLGFEEVRRFDCRRFVVPSGFLSRRTRIPEGFWRALGADWIMQRLALGSAGGNHGVHVERCANFDGADALWKAVRQSYRFTLVHDQPYFDWRYAACPTPYRIFRASRAGSPAGWAVTFANQAVPVGFIAELFAAPDDSETVNALLAACIPDLVNSGCKSIYTWTLETSAQSASHDVLTRVCRFRDPTRLHIAVRYLATGWTTARLQGNGWYLAAGGFDGI